MQSFFSFFSFLGSKDTKDITNTKPIDDIFLPPHVNFDVKEPPKERLFTPYPKFTNVGKFDSMNDRANDILEVENHCWQGLTLTVQNVLHRNFMTAHTIALGKKPNINPYTGEKDDEHSLYGYTAYVRTDNWTVNSRWTTSGVVRGMAQYERGAFSASASGQFATDDKKCAWEADAALSKWDFCLQGKIQGPSLGLAYTQPITSKFSVGTEFFISPLAPTTSNTRLKLLGKHENAAANSTAVIGLTTGIGPNQLNINYTKSVLKNLDFVTGLDVTHNPKDKQWSSVYKLGYSLKTPENSTLRGLVDSTFKVVCMVEEPLSEVVMFQMSAKIDFPKNEYDIGFGLMVNM